MAMDMDSDEGMYIDDPDTDTETSKLDAKTSAGTVGRRVAAYFAFGSTPCNACQVCNKRPRRRRQFSHLSRVQMLDLIIQRNIVATQSMRLCPSCLDQFDISTSQHSGVPATKEQWSTCMTYLGPRLKVRNPCQPDLSEPPTLVAPSESQNNIPPRTRSRAESDKSEAKDGDEQMILDDDAKAVPARLCESDDWDPEDLSFLDDCDGDPEDLSFLDDCDEDWCPPKANPPKHQPLLHSCDNPSCNKTEEQPHTFKHCSHCLFTWYCSQECQHAHWNGEEPHRPVCQALAHHVDRRPDMTKEEAYNAPWHDLRTLLPSEIHALFGLDANSIKNFASRMFPPSPPRRETRGRKPKLSSLDRTKLFLLWFRTAVSQTVLGALFGVSATTAGRIIENILDRAENDFIKFFLGFGPDHQYKGLPIDPHTILEHLSTWTSQQIGKDIFGGRCDILGVADGTYVYCMNAGGFRANKLLYSGHKHRLLSKVMVLCTTRGYILDIWGGFGGGGKFSDVKIWKSIISDAKTDNGPNLCNSLPKTSGIVVDRGFRDKDGELDQHFTLLAPKGNKKPKGKKPKKKSKKTKHADHAEITGDQNYSRFITKIRNVVERINICAIKKWGILGGKNLHHRFLPRVNTLARLAGALFNCYHGPLDDYGDDNDHRQDYETMKKRRYHVNKIPELFDSCYSSFTKRTFDVDELPPLSRDIIRRFATGPYGMTLSERYLRYAREYHGAEDDEDAVTLRGTVYELPPSQQMIEAVGIRSRYRTGVGRTVHILFEDGQIEDTLCTCPGGYRTIGGCAHAIAVLRLLAEMQDGSKWDELPKDPNLSWMLLKGEEEEDDEEEGSHNEDGD